MIDDVQIRGRDADDDFEWINAWAATATASRGRAAYPGTPADLLKASGRSTTSDATPGPVALTPGLSLAAESEPPHADAADGKPSEEERAEDASSPTESTATDSSSAIAMPAPRRERKQWTSLFRLVARAHEPAAERLVTGTASSQESDQAPDAEQGSGGTGAADLDQIERDIAEILWVRDRLLAESATPRRLAGRFRVRTSDYVPIVVGGVLAFTSLVVFAAAASFVSLR
jgi:hypothetical protein